MRQIRDGLQATFAEFIDHMVSIGGTFSVSSGPVEGTLILTCSATVDGEVVTDVIRSTGGVMTAADRLAVMVSCSKFDPMKESKQDIRALGELVNAGLSDAEFLEQAQLYQAGGA